MPVISCLRFSFSLLICSAMSKDNFDIFFAIGLHTNENYNLSNENV